MAEAGRSHLLTIAVEDDFQASALGPVVTRRDWRRLESRVLDNTVAALDLLDAHRARATWFVLGWVASRVPEVVQEIVRRGQEVASKGFLHRTPQSMTREELRTDAAKTREAIERAGGVQVHGHRVARGHLGVSDLWVLEVLAELGFVYDSSFFPRFRSIRRESWRRFPHENRTAAGEIREFPISTWGPDAWLLPMAGGNSFRQLPAWVSRAVIADWERRYQSPFNMYFHVWELDPAAPRIARAGRLRRLRQYRNLDHMRERIEPILESHRFRSIADLLGLDQVAAPVRVETAAASSGVSVRERAGERVTVVVPCFNEAGVLGYLDQVLREMESDLGGRYSFEYVFVDDASTDATREELQRVFGAREGCRIVGHETNRGVAAAILTGLHAASTEIVASIDCDGTYDPTQLAKLIPLLTEDVSMVTASPYHPEGRVIGVPAWRLFLSRTLSRLYRVMLGECPATITSCFRVYRRSRLLDLELRDGGFLGVAETLCILLLRGDRVVERPAVLESRLLGESKMKTLRTILAHLRLLLRLGARRLGAPA